MSAYPKGEVERLEKSVPEIFEELREQTTHWPNLMERLGSRFKELVGEVWHQIEFPPEPRIPW